MFPVSLCMRLMSSSLLFLAPLRRRFFFLLAILPMGFVAPASADEADLRVTTVSSATLAQTRDAIIELIEGIGLPVTAVIPFQGMLSRTAPDLGKPRSPFGGAEIIQFCSARLAWRLIEEDSGQLALCPLSIAIYEGVDGAGGVRIVYRSPGRGSPGRVQADDLLRDLTEKAAILARQRW